jgi:hypothetical protein
VEGFRESKIQNVICLEEIKDIYPHLANVDGEWNGTVEDAVYILAALLRYRYVYGCGRSRRGVEEETSEPMRLWWITQTYVPSQGKRRREIEKCLQMNRESKYIEKVILLNEKIYGIGGEKVEERNIGHRITYEDVMNYAKECPDDVILAFANADIAIDDSTWRNLWTVSLENVCLALLRYDVPENGNIEDALLFGPRADSQDTWVVRAKDVKERGDMWESCRIPFGKGGCDNAFAVQMLRKKFLIVNPARSLRTYHFHASGVRTYNPQDIVNAPIFMHIHPMGFHDMKPVLKFKKEDIIKSEGEPIVKVKNCFATNNGFVFTNREMYIGPSINAQKQWEKEGIHGMSPTVSAEKLLVAPWPSGCEKEEREVFMIQYLSKILKIREATKAYDAQLLCPESKKLIECLECIQWGSGMRQMIRRENDMQVWAKEGWMIPITDTPTILKEDMEALRVSVKEWIETIDCNESSNGKIILMDDGSTMLREIEDVLNQTWDVRVIYPGRTSVERIWDVMRGARGVVCMKGGIVDCGWNWLLPRGAHVIEVKNKDTIGAEISAACDLKHVSVDKTIDSVLKGIFDSSDSSDSSDRDDK